jgi:serine protease
MRMFFIRYLGLGLLALLAPALAMPQQSATEGAEPQRFIIKLRSGASAVNAPDTGGELDALASNAGGELIEARHIAAGIHLLRMRGAESAAQMLLRLRAAPQVQYAEVDRRRYPQSTPDDPLFGDQWYLQDQQPSAVDALDAWSLTTGNWGVVIAELDTGVRFDHPDLRSATVNRLLPGYDMISSVQTGNSGLGRNPDASDPGDWVSAADTKTAVFSGCTVANSSWHGTRVAGILGAITNDAVGIAGLTWSGWVLPVRVLGKCGGYDSDILAGMAWAAGFPVDGVPANPYPARILNMSLGATGDCPQSYQELVDQLVSAGILVVVSAGNEGGPVDAPANCIGVAAVAGLRQVGTKVGFSSLGPEIALSAPAGNCVNSGAGAPCLFSIETTTNSGTTVPETNIYTDQYNINVGTSFSAPLVSGIAGLMLAVNGNLTSGQLIARLQLGVSTPFPAPVGLQACHVPASQTDLQTSECACTPEVCGSGMANAQGAVLQALRPIAAVALPAKVSAGATVNLDGSGSAAACGHKIVGYQWTVTEPAGSTGLLKNSGAAAASLVAPGGSTVYQVMLTVTDDAGRVDSAPVIITSGMANSAAPANAGGNACLSAVSYSQAAPPTSGASSTSSSSGGGGGGPVDLTTLLGLLLLAAAAAQRRYARRSAASSHSRCARR